MNKEDRKNFREYKEFEKLLKKYAAELVKFNMVEELKNDFKNMKSKNDFEKYANYYHLQAFDNNAVVALDKLEEEVYDLADKYGYDRELLALDIWDFKFEYLNKKKVFIKKIKKGSEKHV